MSLADYKPERRGFELSGGSLSFGAITPTHLAILIRTHLPDLEAVLSLVQRGEKMTVEQGMQFITTLVSEAPGLAANIIALACDEEDGAELAKKISFPVQVELLTQIAQMTFVEVGGVKKFMGMMMGVVQENPEMLKNVTRTLTKKAQ